MLEGRLRRVLGRLCAILGLVYLLPVALLWLTSIGSMPIAISARAWSLFFYVHFVSLAVAGIGLQAYFAARTKIFHGGPLIDFLLGVAAFMLLETLSGLALRRGAGPSWPALLPGFLLIAFGARLGTGRPLLGS